MFIRIVNIPPARTVSLSDMRHKLNEGAVIAYWDETINAPNVLIGLFDEVHEHVQYAFTTPGLYRDDFYPSFSIDESVKMALDDDCELLLFETELEFYSWVRRMQEGID